METVTFQCGHCNRLMGVSAAYLGQQVQCPHCRGVVVAPAAAAAAAEPATAPEPEPAPELGPASPFPQGPSFSLDQVHEHESIFSAPNPDDEIFGEEDVPRLELPAPAAPVLAAPPLEETAPFLAPVDEGEGPTAPAGFMAGIPTTEPVPPAEAGGAWQAPVETTGLAGTEGLGGGLSPTSQRASKVGGADSPLRTVVMISLVSYSVLATIGLVLTLFSVSRGKGDEDKVPRWLETLPDVNGDRPGVQKKGAQAVISNLEKVNEMPLPDRLRVKLGETLRIGDVEITPVSVEQKRVSVYVAGFDRPEPCLHDALVLNLKIKNISDTYAFAPLDNYFDRQFRGGTPPLTYLQVGPEQRFYGGPGHWRPLGQPLKQGEEARSWVEGRPMIFPTLTPGESVDTFVCTDASEQVEDALGQHRGGYLWRVHLRRGPVEVEGRSAPVPVTAVVGVTFSSSDIARP